MSFLDFTVMQCTTAHAFLDSYVEAEDSVPQILKERAAVRCLHSWLTIRNGGTIGLGFGL